ncbi:MAG: arsenite methyltransferase [Elusimicrobiota bacterium]
MSKTKDDDIRASVRESYARIARESSGCCGPASAAPGCGCGTKEASSISKAVGYSEKELGAVPDGADLGLGCGNPTAIAALKAGETVLDLGSGGGLDCFLAAKRVGPEGKVIGVDMTPEMIGKARANAAKSGYLNVEFRLGEIEHLPAADHSADVILSNCVINLSPDKPAVYGEAFRVLKPGGRLAISDIVATKELPDAVREDMAKWAGCVAGAALIDDLRKILTAIGFQDIRIRPKEESREAIRTMTPGTDIADHVVSATIEAFKPRA